MAMTQYNGDPEVISKLGTTPQERGLTTEQFKAKFDEGLKAFVEWFNLTHKTEFNALATTEALNAHKAETVSQIIFVTRDATLTGVQSISTSKKPKTIIINASVNSTYKKSSAIWSDNGGDYCMYDYTDALVAISNKTVEIADGIANRTQADVQNVSDTGFELNWAHFGSGATGTMSIFITCLYHD